MTRSRLFRSSLLVSVAIMPMAGAAFAAGNTAFISQLDDSNLAYLAQVGSNSAFIYQHGTQNVFLPLDNGAGPGPGDAQRGTNTLGVDQLGSYNTIGGLFLQDGNNFGGIAQFGDHNLVNRFQQTGQNRGVIFQGGDNNTAQNQQIGTGNDTGIIQLNPVAGGLGNYAISTQLPGAFFDTKDSFSGILQGGTQNVASNAQFEQTNSQATIAQGGSNNQAFNTQTNAFYDALGQSVITQYDMGNGNQAAIFQHGDNNLAINSQDSSTSGFVAIYQDGNGDDDHQPRV